jgi:transposase
MSTQKHYRRCLQQLAANPPKRRVALIRALLPEIEAAVTAGQNLKDIWEALQSEGLEVSYHTFYMVVWRARRRPTAASGRENQSKPSGAQALAKKQVETVEERDPLANLKLLEENRPGFHWRSAKSLNALVHGTEDSNDKNKR